MTCGNEMFYCTLFINILLLLLLLALSNLRANHRLFVRHVRMENNRMADAISRMDGKRFWKLAPKSMTKLPDAIPENIYSPKWIWFNNQPIAI